MRFSETVAHWFGRVELLAFGADDARRDALSALHRGDPMAARAHAKLLLARVPSSKIGLALLADAAFAVGLAEEAAEALLPLAEAMPFCADPWLRLAMARKDAGYPEEEVHEALSRAAVATQDFEARRLAWLMLCDLDLVSEDPARASRWLDRFSGDFENADVALRSAEYALAMGDWERARHAQGALEKLGPASATDGRRALVVGRLQREAEEASAFDWLLRAFVLEAHGAAAELAAFLAECRDAVVVARARRVVRAAGKLEEPRFAAAFALSEGRGEDARRALREGARGGDVEAARALLDLALREQDARALRDAIEATPEAGLGDSALSLSLALADKARGDDRMALDRLDVIPEGPGALWRDELRKGIVEGWLPASGEARWPLLLAELLGAAKKLDCLPMLSAIEAIAMERERPLRVAVVGEFNAGKSTFLNALLGEDVAPTGILPTTATLHWVAWAADPFARIVLRNAPDRVVSHAELKRVLRELAEAFAKVERVFIYAPIELLRRMELLDTPGLNSGDPSHTEAARAAFEEAHLAIWLLDATQPFTESERASLAELARMGLPVLMMLNKRDRLREEQLGAALAYVREGLGATGLVSYREPLAFSAKYALAARLGDEEAWGRSGWEAVRDLLEQIVGESAILRERALRRRAHGIAEALLAEAKPRAEEEEREEGERRVLAERLLRAASRLEKGGEENASGLIARLRESLSTLSADLRPILERSREESLSEGALRYAIDRAMLRLSEPLVLACLERAKLEGVDPSLHAALSSHARALVAGVMAMAGARPLEMPDPSRLAAAALPIFAEVLRDAAKEPGSASPASALAARLRVLSDALSCRALGDRAG